MSWGTYAFMYLLVAACVAMIAVSPFMRWMVGAMFASLANQIMAAPMVWGLFAGASLAAVFAVAQGLDGKTGAALALSVLAACCVGALAAVK